MSRKKGFTVPEETRKKILPIDCVIIKSSEVAKTISITSPTGTKTRVIEGIIVISPGVTQ